MLRNLLKEPPWVYTLEERKRTSERKGSSGAPCMQVCSRSVVRFYFTTLLRMMKDRSTCKGSVQDRFRIGSGSVQDRLRIGSITQRNYLP